MTYFSCTGKLIEMTTPSVIYQGFSSTGKPIPIDSFGNPLDFGFIEGMTLSKVTQVVCLGYLLYKGVKFLKTL